jgi:chemotaxis protein CheZ
MRWSPESADAMNPQDTSDCPVADPAAMYKRIGELTRMLHDALEQLGYDKQIEASLGTLPDTRSRLTYIAKVTGDAAERVLNTVDASQATQAVLLAEADRVEALLKSDPVAAVARGEVLNFIGQVRDSTQRTTAQLTEIMMAQDFHDLTGQTVRKVVDVAATLEASLVNLLVEAQSPQAADAQHQGFLNGPVPDPAGRTDVVADQAQVDALLESLGF